VKNLFVVTFAAAVAALGVAPASAQDKQAPAKQTAEQQKRTEECTRQAQERKLHGRERNQFMSACMRGEKPK
jgi:ribosomal protein L12E/L44/L45/RPP1/RPP2